MKEEKRLHKTRIEHLHYTFTGLPDDPILQKKYRIVVYSIRMEGSRARDHIEWVGECSGTRQREMSRLNTVAKRNGATITPTTPIVTIYSPISGR